MFLHHSPFWLKAVFPKYTWQVPVGEKKLYLTFDDGPIPDVTEFVLDTLERFEAKATFFCIGDNVRKHPHIFEQVIGRGHSIGNHTFNHLNGWKSDDRTYLDNVTLCDRQLGLQTRLFRPPYGRIRRSQAKKLLPEREIIMWDVLSGDFSAAVSPEICLKKTIQYSRAGSIVLFHDSVKAFQNMGYTLPKYLEHFNGLGYRFEALPMQSQELV